MTLPVALVGTLGGGTPVASAVFAYAYYGLYHNACSLRNPFNYDKTLTGIPINAFIQRLDCLTGSVLVDTNEDYGHADMESPLSTRHSNIFKEDIFKEGKSPHRTPRHSPRTPNSIGREPKQVRGVMSQPNLSPGGLSKSRSAPSSPMPKYMLNPADGDVEAAEVSPLSPNTIPESHADDGTTPMENLTDGDMANDMERMRARMKTA